MKMPLPSLVKAIFPELSCLFNITVQEPSLQGQCKFHYASLSKR